MSSLNVFFVCLRNLPLVSPLRLLLSHSPLILSIMVMVMSSLNVFFVCLRNLPLVSPLLFRFLIVSLIFLRPSFRWLALPFLPFCPLCLSVPLVCLPRPLISLPRPFVTLPWPLISLPWPLISLPWPLIRLFRPLIRLSLHFSLNAASLPLHAASGWRPLNLHCVLPITILVILAGAAPVVFSGYGADNAHGAIPALVTIMSSLLVHKVTLARVPPSPVPVLIVPISK